MVKKKTLVDTETDNKSFFSESENIHETTLDEMNTTNVKTDNVLKPRKKKKKILKKKKKRKMINPIEGKLLIHHS